MSFARYLTPILVIAAAVAACSDDDSTSSSTSSGGVPPDTIGSVSSSSYASSSGRIDDPPPYPGSSSSSSSSSSGSTAIDTTTIVTLTMSQDECLKPPGYCADAQSFTVDFLNNELTTTTCVELAGAPDSGAGGTQDARTTKPLSPSSAAAIKKALGVVTVSTDPPPVISDGHAWLLTVSSKSQGQQGYAGWPGCMSQGNYQIESGWQQLWDTIRQQ